MRVVMIIYYLICAYLAGILCWSFIKEKKSINNLILYLLVIIPLILRLLRIK
ncbi:hypothetical protein NLC35_03470 [Candidatus Aminicenantes bacterium AC-334-K16]|jgi:hypothetical protein|nr:hypothetical protein [Candidatus Aminicenantes bacterium AC-334-K16]